MKRLGILLSGRGSNFEAIARNVQTGKIPAEIAVVIGNKQEASGLARAREMGLETRFIPSKGKEREAFDREVVAVLREFQVDLVCLAGFMRILSPYFVWEFPQPDSEHPSRLAPFLSRRRRAAAGAGTRREIHRVHGAPGQRRHGHRAHRVPGGGAGAG